MTKNNVEVGKIVNLIRNVDPRMELTDLKSYFKRLLKKLQLTRWELGKYQMSTMTKISVRSEVSLICIFEYVIALISVPCGCCSISNESPQQRTDISNFCRSKLNTSAIRPTKKGSVEKQYKASSSNRATNEIRSIPLAFMSKEYSTLTDDSSVI